MNSAESIRGNVVCPHPARENPRFGDRSGRDYGLSGRRAIRRFASLPVYFILGITATSTTLSARNCSRENGSRILRIGSAPPKFALQLVYDYIRNYLYKQLQIPSRLYSVKKYLMEMLATFVSAASLAAFLSEF